MGLDDRGILRTFVVQSDIIFDVIVHKAAIMYN